MCTLDCTRSWNAASRRITEASSNHWRRVVVLFFAPLTNRRNTWPLKRERVCIEIFVFVFLFFFLSVCVSSGRQKKTRVVYKFWVFKYWRLPTGYGTVDRLNEFLICIILSLSCFGLGFFVLLLSRDESCQNFILLQCGKFFFNRPTDPIIWAWSENRKWLKPIRADVCNSYFLCVKLFL